MQCIPCGQNILADRLLRNSGYLVEHEVLSTFGFEKSKNAEVSLNLTFKMAALRSFFAIKN